MQVLRPKHTWSRGIHCLSLMGDTPLCTNDCFENVLSSTPKQHSTHYLWTTEPQNDLCWVGSLEIQPAVQTRATSRVNLLSLSYEYFNSHSTRFISTISLHFYLIGTPIVSSVVFFLIILTVMGLLAIQTKLFFTPYSERGAWEKAHKPLLLWPRFIIYHLAITESRKGVLHWFSTVVASWK